MRLFKTTATTLALLVTMSGTVFAAIGGSRSPSVSRPSVSRPAVSRPTPSRTTVNNMHNDGYSGTSMVGVAAAGAVVGAVANEALSDDTPTANATRRVSDDERQEEVRDDGEANHRQADAHEQFNAPPDEPMDNGVPWDAVTVLVGVIVAVVVYRRLSKRV